jgi:GxxExxY protein
MTENQIAKEVVDAAVKVHRELGPGLLEIVYEVVLAKELESRGLRVERQVPVPIVYGGLRFEEGFRADIIVEGKVILELKSVEQIGKVHAKQVFTYLKLKGLKLGFVLNFGANLMKEGIERVVRGLSEENLGVLASWRETQRGFEPGTLPNAPSVFWSRLPRQVLRKPSREGRGGRPEKIFLDDVDCQDFIKTLAETCQKTGLAP